MGAGLVLVSLGFAAGLVFVSTFLKTVCLMGAGLVFVSLGFAAGLALAAGLGFAGALASLGFEAGFFLSFEGSDFFASPAPAAFFAGFFDLASALGGIFIYYNS